MSEHEHGQEHECGHDHGHEYHHGNEHHHEHEHHHDEPSFPSLEMTEHDGAVIGTARFRIFGSYEEAVGILKEKMNETAKEVEQRGGLVGHIKAMVREEKRSCMISVPVSGDVQVREADRPAVMVENANIVFGVSQNELHDILENQYGQWLKT